MAHKLRRQSALFCAKSRSWTEAEVIEDLLTTRVYILFTAKTTGEKTKRKTLKFFSLFECKWSHMRLLLCVNLINQVRATKATHRVHKSRVWQQLGAKMPSHWQTNGQCRIKRNENGLNRLSTSNSRHAHLSLTRDFPLLWFLSGHCFCTKNNVLEEYSGND